MNNLIQQVGEHERSATVCPDDIYEAGLLKKCHMNEVGLKPPCYDKSEKYRLFRVSIIFLKLHVFTFHMIFKIFLTS